MSMGNLRARPNKIEQQMQEQTPPHPSTLIIAKRFADLRAAKGWTAARVGEEMQKSGVKWDRFAVAKLEKGKRQNVTVAELLAFCQIFGVTPMFLLGEDGCAVCAGSPPAGFVCGTCGLGQGE